MMVGPHGVVVVSVDVALALHIAFEFVIERLSLGGEFTCAVVAPKSLRVQSAFSLMLQ